MDKIIHGILLRKKEDIDCSESESAEIKSFLKELHTPDDNDYWDQVMDIQLFFPIEYGEAMDEMEKDPPC